MTLQEFQSAVSRRRGMTGESYAVAAKKLLENLRQEGRVTESNYYGLKRELEKGH